MKTVCITGATSGIGLSLTKLFLHNNFNVIAIGRNISTLVHLKNEFSNQLIIHKCSLIDADERKALLDLLDFSSIDYVINNAAIGLYGSFISHEIEEELGLIELNIKALLAITYKAVENWVQKDKKNTIVQVSSLLDGVSTPLMATYAASKSFVRRFSEALNYELKPTGIRILTYSPGQVATNFRKRASRGRAQNKESFFVLSSDSCAKEIYNKLIYNRKYSFRSILNGCISKIIKTLPTKVLHRVLAKTISRFL